MTGPNDDKTLSIFGESCIKLWEEDSLTPKLTAYDDGAGTWTISFGCTKGVYKGMTITAEQAEQMFKDEMQEFINAMRRRITVKLTQNQADSVISFFYNEGSGAGDSLVRAINAGDFAHVPSAFLLYTKARKGGKGPLVTWPGLVDRRNKEIALWSGTYRDNRIPVAPQIEAVPYTPYAEEPSALMAVSAIPTSEHPATTAAKSPTILSILAALWAGVYSGFEKTIDTLSNLIGSASSIQDDVSSSAAPAQAILSTLKINAPAIGTGIVVVCLLVAIVRHIDLKRGN